VGLTLAVRVRLGAVLLLQGQPEAAAEVFQANADYLAPFRFPEQFTDLPTSMLPNPAGNPATAPLCETYAMWRIRSKAGLDYCAWALRYRNAEDVALAAKNYRRFMVDFAIDTTVLDVLQADAALGLAQLEVAKRNFEQADRWLANRGAVSQLFWHEMREVETKIREGRNGDGPR
jgi:hypothetical protein